MDYSDIRPAGRDRVGFRLFAYPAGQTDEPVVVDLFGSHQTFFHLRLDWDTPANQTNREELLAAFIEGCKRATFLKRVRGTTEIGLPLSPDNPLGLRYLPDANLSSGMPPRFLLTEDASYELELATYIRTAILRYLEPAYLSGKSYGGVYGAVKFDAGLVDSQIDWLLKKRYVEDRTGDKAVSRSLGITDEGLAYLKDAGSRPAGVNALAGDVVTPNTYEYDCFICHATEDKPTFVTSLAARLRDVGCRVWFDEFVLRVGDSLPRKIDEGLARSRHGVVVLSPSFFGIRKHWPRKELDGLAALARERGILPVWLGVTEEDVKRYSPTLASTIATLASEGMDEVVRKLLDAMGKLPTEQARILDNANGIHVPHRSLSARAAASVGDAMRELEAWEESSRARLETLANDMMTKTDSTPYVHGTWSVAYLIDGSFDRPSPAALLDILRRVKGRESGWPPWIVLDAPGKKPYPKDGLVECWLPTTSTGDFWRASPSGKLYLLRFYQEDAGMVEKPKTVIDLTIPVWRAGECLLHAGRFAAALGNPDAEVYVQFKWTGLSGRVLQAIDEPGRSLSEQYRSVEEVIVSHASTRAADIVPRLPELVQSLTEPLYQAFDFFTPSPRMYDEMLTRMGWRGA